MHLLFKTKLLFLVNFYFIESYKENGNTENWSNIKENSVFEFLMQISLVYNL